LTPFGKIEVKVPVTGDDLFKADQDGFTGVIGIPFVNGDKKIIVTDCALDNSAPELFTGAVLNKGSSGKRMMRRAVSNVVELVFEIELLREHLESFSFWFFPALDPESVVPKSGMDSIVKNGAKSYTIHRYGQ
jgi:hypothetical protein